MSQGKGKPEKINIDHILEGDSTEKDEDAIEIVSEDDPSNGGGQPSSAEEISQPSGAAEKDDRALEEAREQIEDLNDRYMRARADFENLKKRVERDRLEERARISADILGEILPAIDNMDRALSQSGEEASLREGVTLIRRQLDEALKKLGLEPIDCLGEQFDPVYHEAMTAEPKEGFAPNTIIEEIRKGYTLGGRVIRPSLVKVVIPPPAAKADSPGETGEADGQDHRD